MDKLLFTPVEAAELLGIGRSRAYAMIASGEIPSIRLGRSVRVPAQDLREFVERQRTAAATEVA